jgi:plastocyanin
MGLPAQSINTFNQKYGSDVNDFFPHGITIRAGDKVKFAPTGFHSLDIPAKGAKPLSLIAQGPAISGVSDAAGTPFWFNGQPQFGFNPALLSSSFGKKFTYTGKKQILSGLPLGNALPPVTVKFSKPGRYTYYCNIHPGMKGVVRVKSRHAKVPSLKANKRAIAKQVKRDTKIAKALVKKSKAHPSASNNSVNVGFAGAHGVELYAMVPGNLTVRAGTALTFHMSRGSFEDHTATFGPGNPETEPASYLGQIAASFQGAQFFDPRAAYPSEAPGSPTPSLSPTFHGNGFWNSGVMDRSAATPLPVDGIVRFDTPGTYNYYCMIHPFMHGTITVK